MKLGFWEFLEYNNNCKKYQLWIINTPLKCELYLWENWSKILPSIEELVTLTKKQAYIRTFQSYKYENNWLGFGRMKWSHKNNLLWTSKYRTNESKKKNLIFFNTEIWAHDWNQFCNTSMPPDIYINLYNQENAGNIKEGFIIALPNMLYRKNVELVNKILNELVDSLPESKIYSVKRQWWPSSGMPNNIEDTFPQQILNCKKIESFKLQPVG